ncbi:hydroxyisourate hydrolase [Salinicola rhizosphaerae]|uniref:5-hydroxyisourate hydrolase n=1 Tax=Salinicola rhizosphaerae TaxID=1443141 RepID=A0ABQ3DRJ0_9GAMM|nr:hydroxyisourate hydrolase [Salinicola rhizosphaerae]GHB13120.1 5-hydroxyisourate hydrolase [Salinicola rhizosphaerae]
MSDATGYLTTHVLDTALGRPAAGLRLELYRLEGGTRSRLADVTTNEDGRCEAPLLEGSDFHAGVYELLFHAGDYLKKASTASGHFLDRIPLQFVVDSPDEHYHVPLLLSPFSYSTYRGS